MSGNKFGTKTGMKKFESLANLGKADLHIHSNYSDARPNINDILEYVENKTDLDIIAITDHDTISGALEAKKIMEKKKYRFELIVGEEVTTIEGHIIGLFLKERITPGLPAHITLREIKKQGGISIASHPFQHSRLQNPDMAVMDGIGAITLLKEKDNLDCVEIVNATPSLAEENFRARLLNSTILFRAEVGSSDAHIVEAIGMGYTIFEGNSVDNLKEAINTRQTKAMNKRWTLLALFRYLFFFIPKGIRMGYYTLLLGRREKKQDI